MTKMLRTTASLILLISLVLPLSSAVAGGSNSASLAPAVPVTFTILHTNDFHGQLEEVLASNPPINDGTSSNPGMARVATIVNGIRTAVGADKVLLVDGGDEMQGSLLSNLQKGEPTIATFNAMGYNMATFGNHEFDWGQTVLGDRTTQAAYPYVTANIVQNDTGNCATAGWTPPTFADAPYEILTVGTAPNEVKVAFIGVTTAETPTITLASATAGLCFKDPAQSISYYYPAMISAGADVIVVLSHLGNVDGGYGYGIPVYGDQNLAARLNTAGTPVHLIIGGHSHTNLSSAQTVGATKVVQAHYNGRKVGRAEITVNPSGVVSVNWTRVWVCAANNTNAACPAGPTPEDAAIKALITSYSSNPAYQALINTEIGWTNAPIARNYDGDSLMGYFVNDAIYGDLNNDAVPENDVDMVFNNAGGLRADITCALYPCLINYGMTFNVLPFGNQTIVGDMRGDKILELLHQSATLFKGAIQPSGIRYSFFRYSDALPGPQPYGWGAYDVTVYNKTTSTWEPLYLTKTYRVGTNEFLAPAGQDGFTPFKYMTNISYWGDMLDAVNRWVSATYPSSGTPYNGALDGRITRNGDGDNLYEAGEIVPLTILHHNDSHGNLDKTPYIGYTQLATLIKQERLHNASRTLLLSSGDNIQGDAMSFYFKTAPTGFTSSGTPILDASMHIQPLIKAFNAMIYDAMVLGNHEFNFGKDVFASILSQADFPLLQANVIDDGSYGLAAANHGVGVQPFVLKTLGGNINVAILGIGNHRIPNYELPSNIPGLTFSDPIAKAQELSTQLGPTNDVVIALTHIGFTALPGSIEVDANVDTNLVANTTGIDAVIGGHSHSDPSRTSTYHYLGDYKYLPSIIADDDGKPVVVTQALRYNNTLGEVAMGLRDLGGGNYEVVSQTGRYIQACAGSRTGTSPYTTCTPDTPEDTAIDAIITPYTTMLNVYNSTVIGTTTTPINTTNAYIAETNAANLQADAAIYELASHGITDVDFHLSGAMTRPSSTSNWVMFPTATPGAPASMKISDMFTLMPYENSLVVLEMNGPQLKTVLERAYRNYYYYKYVPGYGGYSYYTTCMLDTNFGNQITYNDLSPALPNGNNVVSLKIGGVEVDFTDAATNYNVSTVNYLAAGSCNFNDGGATLWPLSQIVADTQYYVRDAVIDYVAFMGTVSPAIEGRLAFLADSLPPVITAALGDPQFVTAPHTFITSATQLTVNVSDQAELPPYLASGLAICSIDVVYPDATAHPEACTPGDNLLHFTGADGVYTITVNAVDKAGNAAEPWIATYVLDNTPPALTKTIGDPKYVDESAAVTFVTSLTSIQVAADDTGGSGVAECTLAFDAGDASAYPSGSPFTLQTPDGPHTLSVVCTDNLQHAATLEEIDTVDDTAPDLTITSPEAKAYLHTEALTLAFSTTDAGSGIKTLEATLDGVPVSTGDVIDLLSLSLGDHMLAARAVDNLDHETNQSVTFSVTATVQSMIAEVNRLAAEGKIDNGGIANSLVKKLENAQKSLDKGKKDAAINQLEAFINEVQAQSGKHITVEAADMLIADARWVIDHLPQ